jgi:hypothetical protein
MSELLQRRISRRKQVVALKVDHIERARVDPAKSPTTLTVLVPDAHKLFGPEDRGKYVVTMTPTSVFAIPATCSGQLCKIAGKADVFLFSPRGQLTPSP